MLAVDFYVFQSLRLVTNGLPPKSRLLIHGIYWSFSVVAVLLFIFIPLVGFESIPKFIRTYVFAIVVGLFIAKSLTAPRLALLGDAAHVVHPIAGLGFNLGLRDAAALADAVMGQFRLGLDPGGPQVLQAYERWRRLDTMMVAAATDGLNRLFSNDVEALRFIRDAGLSVVERVDPLKRFFMREAAGLSGHLPRLMTGEPA